MCEYGLWVGVQGEAGVVGQFSHCSLSARSQCSSEISYVRQFNTMASHSGVGTWRVAVVRVLSSSTPWHLTAGTEVGTDTLPPGQCCEELKMQGGRAGTAGWS